MLTFLPLVAEEVTKLFLMYRHGARTTLYPNPRDQDYFYCDTKTLISITGANNYVASVFDVMNPQLGNCSLGEIIHAGYVQLENLALYMKQKYPSFESDLQTAYLRASFIDRSLASLKAFLDMFNSTNYDIHVADDGLDSMQINSCGYYDKYVDYVLQDEESHKYDAQLNNLKKILNYTDAEPFEWYMARDEFESRLFLQMPLPAGVTREMYEMTEEMSNTQMKLEYCNGDSEKLTKFLKIHSGLFINDELIKHLNSNEKLIVYSGHSESVVPLIKIISNDYDCKNAEFAAFVEIKIINDHGIEYTEAEYNGKQVILNACGQKRCTKTDFEAHLLKYALNDAERNEMCNGPL
ncbi:Acid_phosphatase [Hexamita inflata]|uniref:Acid phosphatase n=1 Tax=Hexamita inflata TaxID=28002 RepID=A0AA86Q9P8_9EUKA|nr:Acid phosphatase [Hexamita inflata]